MNIHRTVLADETNLFWLVSLALRKARQEGDEAAIADCLDDLNLIATMTGNPALRRACLDVLTPAHSAGAVA